MFRKLTSRRWLIWLLVATLWAVLCVVACRWQWGRWEDKSVVQNRINNNYNARPVDARVLLSPTKAPSASDQWRQIIATGTYEPKTLMVRNRPNDDGDFGYETINILDADGIKIVVDRGWVGNGNTARTPAEIPTPPSGKVTVVGWVQPAEKSLGRAEIPGQLSSIATKDIEVETGDKLAQGYVWMRSEKLSDGSVPDRPIALGKPSQGEAAGVNLSYAIQWAFGAVAGYAFVFMRARRELLDERDFGVTDAGNSAGAPSEPEAKTRKPKEKKRRIWDEEDE